MAGNIKGITIEFTGDASKLKKSITDVNKSVRTIDSELKKVNNALKFNPTSVELWRQKQELLTQKIGETENKLKLLKQQQAAMDASGVDKTSAEYRNLEREIITTESKLKTFNAQLRQIGNVRLQAASEQFKEWGSSLESAGQKMRGLSMAAAAVVASLGAISYKAATNADDLNTMSKVYSVSTQDLQKYSYAADLVDVSVETIAKSHVKLEKTMYSAQNGSKTTAEAYKALGVSITDANGNLRDGDTVWNETIAALGKMENETQRDAIAMQLMGKSAAELNPLIEDGGKTFEDIADMMEKYDLEYVDQDTLDKANEFNDSLDKMKLLGSVALAQVGSQLSAYLAPALEKVVSWIGKFTQWLGKVPPEALTVIGVIAAVVAALGPAIIALGKLATGISAIIKVVNTVSTAFTLFTGPVGIVIAVIGALIAAGVLLYKNWDTIKEKAADIKQKLTEVWNSIRDAITKAVNAIKDVVSKVFNVIKTVITTYVNAWKTIITAVWQAITSDVTTKVNAIKTVVTTVFNAIKTVVTTVGEAIKTAVSFVWSGIKTDIETKVNAIKTVVTTVFNALKGTVTTVWNGIKSAIVEPISSAVSTVKGYVDKLKGFFPLSVGKIFSNLKLPHFNISAGKAPFGIGGKGKAPKISIDWYAKGGIFTRPTLLAGTNGLAGVGEAGAEAVLPISKLQEMVDFGNEPLQRLMANQTNILLAMLEELQKEKNFKVDGAWAGRYVNSLVR